MDQRLEHSPYLRACGNKEIDGGRIPIWIMRQAGRYMKAYRDLRERYDFLTLIKTPELASLITMQPVEEFAPDAAIIFADILPLLDAMGLELTFLPGDGPFLKKPIRGEADILDLRPLDVASDLGFTLDAIRAVKQELIPIKTPLIGFSGAPFTLAYYAIEGGGCMSGIKAFSMMHERRDLWHMLLDKLTTAVTDYLLAQAKSGADALQLFDSWAGFLSPSEFETFSLPYVSRVVEGVKASSDIPVTYFSTQTSSYLDLIKKIPVDVLGLDWRIDMKKAWREKGAKAMQGNLSPHVLLGSERTVREQARGLIDGLRSIEPDLKGFIFNLGHGIHKETPMGNVHALFDEVRRMS